VGLGHQQSQQEWEYPSNGGRMFRVPKGGNIGESDERDFENRILHRRKIEH